MPIVLKNQKKAETLIQQVSKEFGRTRTLAGISKAIRKTIVPVPRKQLKALTPVVSGNLRRSAKGMVKKYRGKYKYVGRVGYLTRMQRDNEPHIAQIFIFEKGGKNRNYPAANNIEKVFIANEAMMEREFPINLAAEMDAHILRLALKVGLR